MYGEIKVSDNEILSAIEFFIETFNYPPSFEDLMAATGIQSKSTISTRLQKLRDKGLVDYVDYSPRTITLPNYRYVRCE